MLNYRKTLASSLVASLAVMQFLTAVPAEASVANWRKGIDVVPTSTTDFDSSNFRQSMQDLKNTGATDVSLIIPYYQSNIYSTDVAPGWNTPTDAALASAIDYAHSIGLSVAINMHIDPYDGNWRANINPSDRDTWFHNYGSYLLHLAGIAQSHHAELMVIGSELVDMAAYTQNGDNTRQWQNLIGGIRAVYAGKITYDANSDNNTNGGVFQDEKDYIGFWPQLDYAGLSVYYNLNSDNSLSALEGQWDYWNNADLKGFASRVGKPLLFVEVGYRSIDNAHTEPWNWAMSGNANETEQANDYQALLSYWNNYDYVAGVSFWYWETDPNAGGANSTSYTPQNKTAEGIMKQWFGNSAPPPPPQTNSYSFTATGSANPSNPSAGNSISLSVAVNNMGTSLQNGIVDMEVYDQNNNRVFQKFYDTISIGSGASQTFTSSWTATNAGTYHMQVGIFSGGWATTYYWNSNAAAITVSGSTPLPPSNPPPPTQAPGPLDIWWPTDSAHVSGVVPFKAMLENIDVSQYRLFWQVGTGAKNEMPTNTADYPHKEILVDLSSWNWNGADPYPLTFTATKTDGSTVMATKSINIWIP